MRNDYYNTLHDIYFFHPINEKISELIEEVLDININISKLQKCIYEYCDEHKCTLLECWLFLILELRIKGYEIEKDDLIESFYIGVTGEPNIEMIKEALNKLDYEV